MKEGKKKEEKKREGVPKQKGEKDSGKEGKQE